MLKKKMEHKHIPIDLIPLIMIISKHGDMLVFNVYSYILRSVFSNYCLYLDLTYSVH